jgi:hypothetical protein
MARPKQGYRLADGTRVPGVTTICNRFKDAGGLIRWAYNCGCEGIDMDAARDRAADAGTLAHAMIDAFIRNQAYIEPIDLHQEVAEETRAKAKHAFEQFRDWWEQSMVVIDTTETPLVSEKHRFGGTRDAGARVNGKRLLLDWKTSNGVYAEFIMQLGGYALLWEEHHPEDPLEGAQLLRFSKEEAGFTAHSWGPSVLETGKRAFLKARELYDLDRQLKACI